MSFSESEIRVLKALAAGLLGASPQAGSATQSSRPIADTRGEVADAGDLDSQWGDETIKRDPSAKYWSGDSYKDSPMSHCPADYLDAFAKYKDACAYANLKEGDAAKAKFADYDKRSARRARGWAARVRSGQVTPPVKQPAASNDYGGQSDADDSDLPF